MIPKEPCPFTIIGILSPGSKIGTPERGDHTQFQYASMIDHQRGLPLIQFICQFCIIGGKLLSVVTGGAMALNCIGIGSKGLRPWNFTFHIDAIATHSRVLFVDRKTHGNRGFKGTRQRGGDHAPKRTKLLPHTTRQAHPGLIQMITGFISDGVASNFDRFHSYQYVTPALGQGDIYTSLRFLTERIGNLLLKAGYFRQKSISLQ